MVTITKIGEEYNSQILEISGLSTDPKPVGQIDGVSIANGSTFKEIDTGKEYTYNESAETWHINKSASSGGGGGVDGEDGGYYTPGVTQPTADTMQISFAPSKSDMPAVNPVTVNLPVSENSGQNSDKIPASADLNGTTATFRNSAGVALFTLDLSGLGGSAAVYGNLVLSAEELAITEGRSGTFTVALDKAPTVNQPVYLAVSDGSRLSVAPATLTFTPDNWETPQTVTVTSLEDDDEEDNAITVTLTSTAVDARQVAVAIQDNDVTIEIVTDGLAFFADYTRWDGVSDTMTDVAGGVTLTGLSNWVKVDNGVRQKSDVNWKSIRMDGTSDGFSNVVSAFNGPELTIEWFGSFIQSAWEMYRINGPGSTARNPQPVTSVLSMYGALSNDIGVFYTSRAYYDADGTYTLKKSSFNPAKGVEYVADFAHFVAVFRSNGVTEVYHNGELAGTWSPESWSGWVPVGSTGADPISGIGYLVRGAEAESKITSDTAWLASQRLYGRALTQDEIRQNMHAEGIRLGLMDFI